MYDVSSCELEAFNNAKLHRNWASEFDSRDLNGAFDLFYEAFKANADTSLLTDKVISQHSRDKVWITEDIKGLIRQRERLHLKSKIP